MNDTNFSTVDYGVFGKEILASYCGSDITAPFYDTTDGSEAFLLTESAMGKIAIRNFTEFATFSLLSILLQAIFIIYYKSIKQCYDRNQEESKQPKCCQSFKQSKWAKCANIISLIWMFALAGFVLSHLIMEFQNYYEFVNQTVTFEDMNIDPGSEMSIELCDEEGIGKLACPSLFHKFDELANDDIPKDEINYTDGYDPDNAGNICKWIFYVSVIANPNVFQYSLLASFIIFDTVIYFLTIILASVCCSLCCNCCACITCWCGCCEKCGFSPAARGCCSTASGWCCDCSGM